MNNKVDTMVRSYLYWGYVMDKALGKSHQAYYGPYPEVCGLTAKVLTESGFTLSPTISYPPTHMTQPD